MRQRAYLCVKLIRIIKSIIKLRKYLSLPLHFSFSPSLEGLSKKINFWIRSHYTKKNRKYLTVLFLGAYRIFISQLSHNHFVCNCKLKIDYIILAILWKDKTVHNTLLKKPSKCITQNCRLTFLMIKTTFYNMRNK